MYPNYGNSNAVWIHMIHFHALPGSKIFGANNIFVRTVYIHLQNTCGILGIFLLKIVNTS